MDRLLSEQEICDTCPAVAMITWEQESLRCCPDDCLVHPDLTRVAAAQLLKSDKEWVEWANGICTEHTMDNVLLPGRFRRTCDFCWQERKREVGQ